jgi:spore germination protein KC
MSGCWDQSEIKEKTVVIGLGIDKVSGANPILLTAQVISLPTSKNIGGSQGGSSNSGVSGISGGGSLQSKESSKTGPANTGQDSGPGNSVTVITSTGKSFYEAVHNFLKYSSRQIMFSHNRVIVFGKELAESGIADICDAMARDYQFRRTNWVLVAENNAQEILTAKTDMGNLPAKELDHLLNDLTQNAMIFPVHLNDLLLGLSGEGHAGSVPLVRVESGNFNPTPRIIIETNAVFKNSRLIGILDPDESHGLVWLTPGKKDGFLVFPFNGGLGQKMISLEIAKGTSKIRPRITKEGLVMDITCSGKGILRETEGLNNNPQTVKQLERRVDQILSTRVKETIQKAQQIKTDFFGFATLFHGDDPEEWRRIKGDWDQEFSRIKTRIRFQINIASFGIIKDSLLTSGGQE